MKSEQFYIILRIDSFRSCRDVRSVTGAGVLAAGRPVVVRPVAGAVVIVVGRVEEVHLAPVTIAQQGVAVGRAAPEGNGDGVAIGVAATHRLTPVAAHDYSLGVVRRMPQLIFHQLGKINRGMSPSM